MDRLKPGYVSAIGRNNFRRRSIAWRPVVPVLDMWRIMEEVVEDGLYHVTTTLNQQKSRGLQIFFKKRAKNNEATLAKGSVASMTKQCGAAG